MEGAGEGPLYKGFRFPAEVISHAVWLYHRFPLSFREVEELLLARGITVFHEAIRRRCDRFGPRYAAALRRRRPQAGDKRHLDEVFLKINGVRHYLWRAVDQDSTVLGILLQSKRDAKAAKRFMAKLMKKQRRKPRVLVTDKLRSYGVAHRKLMSSADHRSHKGLNNRADSHQSTRQRERAMRGFHTVGRTQRFLSAFRQISPHFRPRRHRMTATGYRTEMRHRFGTWNEITGTTAMPTEAEPEAETKPSTPPHTLK
ncbi:IS6 family transposase [Streptomyces sp. NPDC056323]|uniref:IS6 family transposase n=1 Tax=unclassified Streptomyces TaxID=2593676 RepID=UPI0035DEE072